MDGERRPQYHGNVRRSSGAPVRLHLAQGVIGDNGALFRVHGALMLVAWLCTASVGMLIARWVGFYRSCHKLCVECYP